MTVICCKARVTFRVCKLGRYVIVYVGCICHVSLNVRMKENWSLCNSICRPYMSCFTKRSKKRKYKKDKKNDNSSLRELGTPVVLQLYETLYVTLI